MKNMLSDIQLTEEEKEVLAFLAKTRRVDKRWLSDEQKLRIRSVIEQLHNTKNLSLLRISKEVGRSYTAIWGLCRALEIHTRNVAEADRNSISIRSKHKRTPFDGSEEDRAYMLGFRQSDLTAWQVSGTAVMVTSSTTHPGFVILFKQLFEKYGPLYHYPMHEEGKGYKWKLATRLDNSFQFLLRTWKETIEWASQDSALFWAWLAGFVDGDGYVHLSGSNNYSRVSLDLCNSNKHLLRLVKRRLEKFGYHPTGPYKSFKTGYTTRSGITYKKDMYRLVLQRRAEAQGVLELLPLRHEEKIERKELALSVRPKQKWQIVRMKAQEIKERIRSSVHGYVDLAESEYWIRKKHARGSKPMTIT